MNHFLPAALWMCSTVQDCKKRALVGDRGLCSFRSVQHSHPCKSVIEWRFTLGLCLCYPRDDSVTYWYNDSLVKQAEAGPSYRSSVRNLLSIHMHSQKMFKYTCELAKYKIKWKKKKVKTYLLDILVALFVCSKTDRAHWLPGSGRLLWRTADSSFSL